jgi:hypothetical protein
MQQPRQMYGLGSFVKKAVRKVTKPFTKVAKKIVPKEVAGIMRVAAPFLPPGYREAAYLLGTAKQTGRISPIDLALTAAPTFFSKTDMGRGIAQRVGDFTLPGMERNLRDVTLGTPAFSGTTETIQRSPMGRTMTLEGVGARDATSGILGEGGKFFQFGVKDSPKILDTKAGQFLLGGEDGKFSKAKVAGVGVGLLSLIQNSKTPDEAGQALAASTGNSDDYDRGYALFSQLKPELFQVPEEFRMNVKDGGIMRTNYAKGSDDDKPVLPEDPTKPINPFGPKPIKPLGDMKMAEFDLKDYMEEFERVFPDMKEKRGTQEYMDMLEDYFRGLASKDREGIMMAGGFNDKYMSPEYADEFKKFLQELKEQNKEQDLDNIMEMFKQKMRRQDPILEAKDGGRANLALGTKPTAEESGLGGLPIEADMRYTGGFMPYGAKEKADDVPARLSKNEFVFTADAVRAAGGGSVNEGAKKMYATMKQLEAKPEAKGMTA